MAIGTYIGESVGIEVSTTDVAAFVTFLIIVICLYIYLGFSLMLIAKRMKYSKPWIAFIPFANVAMMYHLGKIDWKWVFLMLLPIILPKTNVIVIAAIPWILFYAKANSVIFEKLRYSKWLALPILFWFIPYANYFGYAAYFVIIGIVAFKKKN